MKKQFASLLGLVGLLTFWGKLGFASEADDLLDSLAKSRAEVIASRSAEPGSVPTPNSRALSERLPNLSALRGVPLRLIIQRLGRPDGCTVEVSDECAPGGQGQEAAGSVGYDFHPYGWTGALDLDLKVDKSRLVQEATWDVLR